MKSDKIQKIRKIESFTRYNQYRLKRDVKETITGWIMLSPLLVVVILFVTVSIIMALILTLYEGSYSSLEFIGLKNWSRVFSDSSLGFANAFRNSLFYAAITIPTTLFIGLFVSSILNSSKIKGKNFWLTLFFFPSITSAVAATIIFKILVSKNGLISIDPIKNPRSIMWVVIVSAIWGGSGGGMVGWNTAFSTLDKSQMDAAQLDGAGKFKMFTFVTLPSLSPMISYSLIMGLMGGLGVFDGPFLLLSSESSGASLEGAETLMVLGFKWIKPFNGIYNYGLGLTILFVVAMILGLATFVGNILMPLNKKVV